MSTLALQRSSSSALRRAEAAQASEPVLERGDRGAPVKRLQESLSAAGHPLRADGVFGPRTSAAVRAFQKENGCTVDGKVGPQTRAALQRAAAAGPATRGAVDSAVDSRGGRPLGVDSRGELRAPRVEAAQEGQGMLRARDLQTPPQRRAPRDVSGADPATPSSSQATRGAQNRTATFDSFSKVGQRNQMVTGKITVNGNTYDFRSGGHKRGNLPAGDYTITPHRWSRSDPSMSVGGVGYSFAMSDKYDARVGGTRTLLRIHPDGRSPGTEGCMGIVGNAATQRRFLADMRAELQRNGGRFTLRVG